ncbi:hypothetical protein NHX12_033478 [Muraenolepis orangiensis]|uniref:Reverse transcriptase domain-containing protein n=2 Tax=Muraenolepis orangiensis TaxID=630683 RepID=A0A9Q0E3S1_9TELE|nr:hypothetical protein NHX12_033478 [Muraenolepis orangiensis]
MRELEIGIVDMQSLAESTGNRGHIEELTAKKTALSSLLGVKAQGALVRSRFMNAMHMDAPSHYFFSLERRNGQRKIFHSLCTENGTTVYEHDEIRRYAAAFYKGLYASEVVSHTESAQPFFEGLPQVQANKVLEEVLSMEELKEALQSLKVGKAPGIDGLPADFFKSFWPVIGEDLLDVLKDSLATGCLPLSCRRAVVTLLPKKGDLQQLKNWRPVSLLCTDYKLLSKVLATRLGRVLAEVIHVDQSYCVPGRLITDNVMLIRDFLEVSGSLEIETGLISIDQEKAFDRVEHQYLWRTLQAFGFSPGFIAMIQVLYRDIESMVKINGGLSAPFKVQRGVRQGCILSGMLYSLAIEPLLHNLRRKLAGRKMFQLTLVSDIPPVLTSLCTAGTKNTRSALMINKTKLAIGVEVTRESQKPRPGAVERQTLAVGSPRLPGRHRMFP